LEKPRVDINGGVVEKRTEYFDWSNYEGEKPVHVTPTKAKKGEKAV